MDFNQSNNMVPIQIDYQQQQHQQVKSRMPMKRTYSSISLTDDVVTQSSLEQRNNIDKEYNQKFSGPNTLQQEEPDNMNRNVVPLPHQQQQQQQQQQQLQLQQQQLLQQQQQQAQANHFPNQQMPNFENENVTANMIDLFDGAIYVVSQQLDKTIRESSCAVCHRSFDNPGALKFATDTFISSQNTLKMRRTLLASSMGGNYPSPESNCNTNNNSTNNSNSNGPTSARRLGYQTYLRQIKHDCLREKECVVCHRSFDHAQSMMPLLSHIDKLLDSCSSRFSAEPSW